jgi:hypothetical protein
VKETPIFDLPYPEAADPPNGAAQVQAAVEKVEELLAQIEDLLLTEPGAGNIIIVSGTGDPVYKAVTGDVTLSTTGVTSIGVGKVLEAMLGGEAVATAKIKALAVTAAKLAEGAVETAKLANLSVTEAKLAALAVTAGKLAAEAVETGKIKNQAVTTAKIALLAITEGLIADGAVTSRKAKLTAGVKGPSADFNLTNAYQDVPDTAIEITPAVASTLLVVASFNFIFEDVSGQFRAQGTMSLDGEDQASAANAGADSNAAIDEPNTGVMVYALPLSAAKHTIKMRARYDVRPGGGNVRLQDAATQYLYLLTAS